MSGEKTSLVPSAPSEQELYRDMVDDARTLQDTDAPPPYTAVPQNGDLSVAGNDNNMMLEPARNLIRNLKFKEAAIMLEKLSPSQSQQLMLAECYIQLRRNMNATKRIIELERSMTSSPRPKLSDVTAVIDSYIDNNQNIRALILLLCVSKLYKLELNPSVAARRLHGEVAVKCYEIIKIMRKEGEHMLNIAKEFAMEILFELLSEIRSICAHHDVKPNLKVVQEAYSINLIAAAYGALGEHKAEIEYCNDGIEFMEQKCGEDASKYRIYGHLWSNKAIAYSPSGDHNESEKVYFEVLKHYGKVEDWLNEAQKKKFIGETEHRQQLEQNINKKMNQK